MERRGEGIVDQLPMTILALEGNARNVQFAIAHITDGEGAFRAAAGFHSPEA